MGLVFQDNPFPEIRRSYETPQRITDFSTLDKNKKTRFRPGFWCHIGVNLIAPQSRPLSVIVAHCHSFLYL